ncbi:hypothetical protein QBC41DRAFT_386394 [Cercophora samala]|uniref:Uncharacterized protein n=1 Tax=Cercophora samala TaxID=330535 RepID=A0AA40DC75_9PEZI|nr:hypothetical protein QBC41DRAFT_386394 [Cercophora samala]
MIVLEHKTLPHATTSPNSSDSSSDPEIPQWLQSEESHIPLAVVWKTVKHSRRWLHFVSTFCVFSTWSPLTTYTPSIIMSFGFDRITANALAAVGASLAPLVAFTLATISDATNKRGSTVVTGQLCRWGLWTAINALAVGYHPVHNTWLQLNCHDAEERSISITMWVMSANTGMMVGTWYYRANDRPSGYHTGLLIQIGMVSLGLAAAVVQEIVYLVHNRRLTGKPKGVFRPDEQPRKKSVMYVP